MRPIQALYMKLRAALLRARVEREMEAELADHLESETQDLMARGLSEAEARRRAVEALGRPDIVREECRDARGTVWWEQLRQDVSFSLRLLWKNRVFSSMALATMALGIGSTTAVFSLIDGLLLRPLPFARPDRLFHVNDIDMVGAFGTLRSNAQLAEYAAHLDVHPFNAAGRERPESLRGCEVSANFFGVLDARPRLGRTFSTEEERPQGPRTVILSHGFWVDRFSARVDVIGQQLILDERPYEIVGVMPATFRYPSPEAQFWVPLKLNPASAGAYWGMGGLSVFARLRGEATQTAAEAELRAWVSRIRGMFPWRMPDEWGVGARMTGLQEHEVSGAKVRSLLLGAVAALVLLIVVVNLSSLLSGQSAARRREFSLRLSLGATPGRLARQLLTEALVLAMAGGGLGILLALAQWPLLKSLLPADTPRLSEISIDGRVLAFTAALSMACGLLFGLLPAMRAYRLTALVPTEDGRSTTTAKGARTGAALVVAEAAFATMLLVSSGMLLRSLSNVLRVDPGFQTQPVVTAQLRLNRETAASLEKTAAMFDRVHDRLVAYPGVVHVAAMNVLPLTQEASYVTAAIEDHPRPPDQPQIALWSTVVTPEHLATLGVRLLQGRGFTVADTQTSERVALISRSTARRFWPSGSPLGRRFRPVATQQWRTIVGVVDDVKNFSITGPPDWVEGEVYVPLTQSSYTPRSLALVARLDGDPSDFERALPATIAKVCTNCVVEKVASLQWVVDRAAATPRSMAGLVGSLALLALTLAAAGIFGVVHHGVVRRTRELGVRLALGAPRGNIARLVMATSLSYTLLGTTVGVSLAWVLARWMRTLLYGMTEHDPAAFGGAPLVLIAMAVCASLGPIYRAVRIDPATVLRDS
ncbi:ABC transporter permease [uncultured Paludibaculum sp.]|uniref:ABC transporter permease n=1 Tax=uncultured Paludibaculum sp. TaxID=1765020 RepID=UPI002AABB37E|nr:ABC transporter permease [uncultured Paludibaculum sp.]